VDDAFLSACLASGVSYCPTLTVAAGYQRLATGDLPDALWDSLEEVSPWVAERVRATQVRDPLPESVRARRQAASEARDALLAANLLRMVSAGVPVVLGTDAGNPLTLHGPSVVEELQAMLDAGLAADQVLRAATSDAARALGLDESGRLQSGADADLLVLPADPRDDITGLARPEWVMRRGVLHRRRDLIAP
jgi:imidazolonepropionase-like amidohydrolase